VQPKSRIAIRRPISWAPGNSDLRVRSFDLNSFESGHVAQKRTRIRGVEHRVDAQISELCIAQDDGHVRIPVELLEHIAERLSVKPELLLQPANRGRRVRPLRARNGTVATDAKLLTCRDECLVQARVGRARAAGTRPSLSWRCGIRGRR